MKKMLLTMLVLLAGLTAQAGSFDYLTFETTDGAKISVPSASLILTFSDATLTAGNQSFTITNLRKMYFTTSDETSTGISTLTAPAIDEAAEIYDLQGHRQTKTQMKSGHAYIVKTKQGIHKLIVK